MKPGQSPHRQGIINNNKDESRIARRTRSKPSAFKTSSFVQTGWYSTTIYREATQQVVKGKVHLKIPDQSILEQTPMEGGLRSGQKTEEGGRIGSWKRGTVTIISCSYFHISRASLFVLRASFAAAGWSTTHTTADDHPRYVVVPQYWFDDKVRF